MKYSIIQFATVLYLAWFSMSVMAMEPVDNYYANDLSAAISQAKQQPHHYDYSNNYRYKRTTVQSIELNKLDFEELDDTRLSMGPEQEAQQSPSNRMTLLENNTENNQTRIEDNSLNRAPSALNNENDQMALPRELNLPINSRYENSAGTYETSGIIQNSTVVSTIKP